MSLSTSPLKTSSEVVDEFLSLYLTEIRVHVIKTLTQLLIVHLGATEVLVSRVVGQLHRVYRIHVKAKDLNGLLRELGWMDLN